MTTKRRTTSALLTFYIWFTLSGRSWGGWGCISCGRNCKKEIRIMTNESRCASIKRQTDNTHQYIQKLNHGALTYVMRYKLTYVMLQRGVMLHLAYHSSRTRNTRIPYSILIFRLPRGYPPPYNFFDITHFASGINFWRFRLLLEVHLRTFIGINCDDSPCHYQVIPYIPNIPRVV